MFQMNNLTRKKIAGAIAASLMATMVAMPTTLSAQSNMPAAIGTFPKDADMAVAFDMNAVRAFNDSIPDMDIFSTIKTLNQQSGVQSDPLTDVFLFNPEANRMLHTMAFTMKLGPDMDLENPATSLGVMLGTFNKEQAEEKLRGAGVAIRKDEDSGYYQYHYENNEYFVSVPVDNVILWGTDKAWLETAIDASTNSTGLMAPDTKFSQTVSTLGGRLPSTLIYFDGRLIKSAVDSDPSLGMFLGGPQGAAQGTNGLAFCIFGGASRSLEAHINSATSQSANAWQMAINGGLTMIRSQVGMMAGTPEGDEAIKALNSIQVNSSNNSTVLTFPISDEVLEQFMVGFQMGLSGQMGQF